MQNCIGPVFCRDRNGICCLLVNDRGRFLCPVTCVEPSASSRLQLFAYKLLNSQGNFSDYQDSTDSDESIGNINYNIYDPYYNTEFDTYSETYNDSDVSTRNINYNIYDPYYNTEYETHPQTYNDYYQTNVYDDNKNNYEEFPQTWDNYYHNYDQSDWIPHDNKYYQTEEDSSPQ